MYLLETRQKLPISLEEAWEFFSSPNNLSLITPEYLGFTMSHSEESMYAGQILTYKLRPFLHIPIEWVTEITHVEKPYYFVDEQRKGPYKLWHHEHHFTAIEGGVEMVDKMSYLLPYGPIGHLLHQLKVKKDLERIFSYRKEKLDSLFGKFATDKH